MTYGPLVALKAWKVERTRLRLATYIHVFSFWRGKFSSTATHVNYMCIFCVRNSTRWTSTSLKIPGVTKATLLLEMVWCSAQQSVSVHVTETCTSKIIMCELPCCKFTRKINIKCLRKKPLEDLSAIQTRFLRVCLWSKEFPRKNSQLNIKLWFLTIYQQFWVFLGALSSPRVVNESVGSPVRRVWRSVAALQLRYRSLDQAELIGGRIPKAVVKPIMVNENMLGKL